MSIVAWSSRMSPLMFVPGKSEAPKSSTIVPSGAVSHADKSPTYGWSIVSSTSTSVIVPTTPFAGALIVSVVLICPGSGISIGVAG